MVITLEAVDGIVKVVSGVGRRKRVDVFKIPADGSQKSYRPLIRLTGLK